MKKFFVTLFSVLVCSIVVMCAACKGSRNDENETKKPEKLKDGIALVLTEGESQNIDLSEYISIEGTDYAYAVSSSDGDIAAATLDGNTATVTAVSAGSATVTASADEVSVTFAVTVNEKQQQQPDEKPAPEFKDVVIEYDLLDVNSRTVTLTPKSGSTTFNYTFTLKEQDNKVTIEGNRLTVSYEQTVEKQLVIVATYTDSENASAGAKTVEFNLSIKVTDTREQPDLNAKFKVVNGSFDNGLEGWTIEGEIGYITEQSTFWEQNFPIFNVGKYFSGNDKENAKGTLTSSTFEVGGINKISFKLGAAGNSECYITLEKADGTVLEIWRNTKFEDVGDWQMEEIGKTQFACNLVTYVADLTEYEGETLKIVLHDNAESHYGFFNFDELITYYASEEDLPEGVAAVNQLADKTALKTVVDNALTEQGDYTEESFNAYRETVTAAQAVLDKFAATQAEVDAAKANIENTVLVLRTPEEVSGAVKTFAILSGLSKEITLADYIDAKNLSAMTYELNSDNALVTVGEIQDGKFTVTAGETEENAEATVTIIAKYKGESKLTVTLTLQVQCELQPFTKQPQVTKTVDIFTLENNNALTIDFTENIESNGVENLVYSVTSGGDNVTLDNDNCLTYNFDGSYNETATVVEFNVVVSYGNNKSVSYTYTLKISDTTAYRVVNGSFNDDFEGWTMEGDIGYITEQDKFWEQKFPIFNEGKYFSGNDKESAKGTLTSSTFVVGGINKITFKLGAAGNSECYITLEKADGTVLEIWRNTKFEDINDWKEEEIGKTQFACNLVTYIADLTEYEGETLKIVLHDNAESHYGFFNFDELITYYASEKDLPEGVAAINQLADKTDLKTVVDNALTEQGDYTEESFNAYRETVTAAQVVLDKFAATQAEVDAAKEALDAAYEALEARKPVTKTGAETSFRLLVNNSKELTISDYVDDKDISSLTYEVKAENEKITVSTIAEGKFTVTAGSEEVTGAIVTIVVKYNEQIVLTVELAVTVTAETAPTLKEDAVVKNIDLFTENNKESITLDFAENVDNLGELDLIYTVTKDGEPLTLDEPSYTFNYGSYTDAVIEVVFEVKVSYNQNGKPGELNYNYTLNIKDTRAYRIANGGFDDGLEGWTLSNNKLGSITEDTHYWLNDTESAAGFAFGNDGKFFSAYADGEESAMGTLTSSAFEIGGSGYITYMIGAAKNADKVYIDIVEKDTGVILGRYSNNLWQERTDGVKSGCTLIAYKADMSAHIGKTVYIRISDNAENDYGLFFVDRFVTYYNTIPEVSNTAEEQEHPANVKTGEAVSKYQVYNGGFESDLEGWTCVDGAIPGAVSSANRYWGADYGNTGKLFTAVEGHGDDTPHDPNLEHRIGTIRSEKFTLKANAWISFRLGGANYDTLGIRIVKTDGTVIARFQNTNVSSAGEGQLVQYKYHFDNAEEVECYIEIFDNEPNPEVDARPWRLVVVDEIITDLEAEPAEGLVATNQIS